MTRPAQIGTPTVFLDRDGTIIIDKGYLHDPDEVALEQGAIAGLQTLARAGARLIVVTNQSGVARGYFDEASVIAVNERVAQLLAPHGVRIAGWYFCPHAATDVCACRKPALGLLLQAQRDFDIDLSSSFVIGDKLSDVEMARAVNAVGILVETGEGSALTQQAKHLGFDVADDLEIAAKIITRQLDLGPSHV